MSETVWQGRYLTVEKDGEWEYAARKDDIGAAVIVALDKDEDGDGNGDAVLLVEQFRKPVGRVCLELPAGLVGDEGAPESVTDAAARELEEETGYRAARVEELGEFFSSPGMTSERFSVVRATGLSRTGEAEEGITVHRVPLAEVAGFVAARRAAGIGMDAKLLILLGSGMIG